MEDKKKIKEMKRDARMERRYGIPLMRKIADNEKEARREWVADYYFRFRAKRREGTFDLVMVAIFMLLATLDIVMCIITAKEGWGNTFAVDVLLSLYWLLSFRICEVEADRFLDKFIDLADYKSKEKAVNSEMGKDEDGTDKAEKVD